MKSGRRAISPRGVSSHNTLRPVRLRLQRSTLSSTQRVLQLMLWTRGTGSGHHAPECVRATESAWTTVAYSRPKNGTVTSMPRGFERICLVLGASYTWTFIVVPARIYAGSDPVRPFAARLPEQCFPECGAFPGPMGQAGAGWLPSDARPVCSSD